MWRGGWDLTCRREEREEFDMRSGVSARFGLQKQETVGNRHFDSCPRTPGTAQPIPRLAFVNCAVPKHAPAPVLLLNSRCRTQAMRAWPSVLAISALPRRYHSSNTLFVELASLSVLVACHSRPRLEHSRIRFQSPRALRGQLQHSRCKTQSNCAHP